MIRKAVELARREGVKPGEVLEVHVRGDAFGYVVRTDHATFVRNWLGGWRHGSTPLNAHVGVVHENGAVLVDIADRSR